MLDGNKKWLVLALVFLAGVASANKIRSLPLGSKIPTI